MQHQLTKKQRLARTQRRWREKARTKKAKMKERERLCELGVEEDDGMTIHMVPGRPRIETTERGRLLAAAMTEVAKSYTETDPRRRAEENVINQTVKGFTKKVNEYIGDRIGRNDQDIAKSTIYNRTSYNYNISSSHSQS